MQPKPLRLALELSLNVSVFKAPDNTLHTLSLFKATILIELHVRVTPYRSSAFRVTHSRGGKSESGQRLDFTLTCLQAICHLVAIYPNCKLSVLFLFRGRLSLTI